LGNNRKESENDMLKSCRKKRRNKGFTLIELMIVIAIIGILAAIAIPQFMKYRQMGYNMTAKAELKSFFTACQAYFSDNSTDECTIDSIADSFVPTVQIIPVNGPDHSLNGTTARHPRGNETYQIVDGLIIP